jgi:hypothetical protein
MGGGGKGPIRRAAALLGWMVVVASRSGPRAPVAVTLAPVDARPVTPALFGDGAPRHAHARILHDMAQRLETAVIVVTHEKAGEGRSFD